MKPAPSEPAWFSWDTAPVSPGEGAIAAVRISAPSAAALDAALARLLGGPVHIGQARLRRAGQTEVFAARWGPLDAHLMPHAGRVIREELSACLCAAGIAPRAEGAPLEAFPEAADRVEAMMLSALAGAASPLAIDLLLAQPRRWREWDRVSPAPSEVGAVSAALNRLLEPPLVVAVGPSNIGKSTLLNSLAGRPVALVFDAPGVTRDHVGAMLDLGGLVVRWADTPGLRETADPLEREAQAAALALAERADLIVSCGDAASGFLPSGAIPSRPRVIRVALRADRGRLAEADIETAAIERRGLRELSDAVGEALVPRAAREWPGPWRFDPALE